MNYRMIRNILGYLLLFEAIFLLCPALVALIYRETEGLSYLAAAGACVMVGGLFLIGKAKNRALFSRDGFVIVALSWIVLSLFGALPLWFTREIPVFIDALFESASGFTTTGASILTEVESLSHASLFWRSFTHWIGGMGVLVFIMAFLPLSGGQNMHIMRAESPGPSVSKLVPRVRTTAMLLYLIYIVLTLSELLVLLIAGMDFFDALNTSLATAGTGGFGFRNDSFASFPARQQWIVGIFMALFSINFSSYFFLIHGRVKEFFNLEARVFFGILFGATALITWNIASSFPSVSDAARNAFFTVSSVMSTTGFVSTDFNLWPEFSKTVLVLLMFGGACAGSTCGGMKLSRIVILFKGLVREFRTAIHPKQVKRITVDGRPVEEGVVHTVFIYAFCLFAVLAGSVLLISADRADLTTNVTAVITTLNNVGPGLNLVGPTGNFAFYSGFSKAVLIFDMLAGRLELFPMLLLFYPRTWKHH